MSNPENVDDFFDNTGEGGPLPSAVLKNVDDFVIGEIVDQRKIDKIKFGTKDTVEVDRFSGEPIKQLQVVLQTDLRNWEGVVKVPLADREDASKGNMDPSLDEGKRAVYIAPWTNLHAAIGDAIVAGTGKKQGLKVGGRLGIKVTALEDTGKGNPKKVHAAQYTAPSASDAFFGGNEQAQPAQPVQQAAAPAAAPAPAPVQQDPWQTQSAPASQTTSPPF